MIGLHFVVAAAMVSMVSALPANVTSVQRTCGSVLSVAEMAAAEDYFNSHKPQSDMSAFAANLKVYWHVISTNNTLKGGNIPDSQIQDSMRVLNQDYVRRTPSFQTKSGLLTPVPMHSNPPAYPSHLQELIAPPTQVGSKHHREGHSQQTEMKQTLRKGGAADLNVYSVGSIVDPSTGEPGILGYATFPSSYVTNPKDDGVVFLYSTVPKGSEAPFNLGRTLTHEVGHWTGLYHTFEDHQNGRGSGCSAPGDHVVDTPPEDSPAFGCPIGRDSCPQGGVDPIHNFMDYTNDACMNEFTTGQIVRLKEQILTFRGVQSF
ncbi:unnamed protein product [Rhizoctonia solani]|uniref:Peptidase M43 pregnancy-associated plasma-A domain-containing protein n=1 Tax=Rhizoctonia solani TaxID=456999 RepID=A0A8H3AQT7_9AGAM|nr:unnamed protein product [Rhizoctonia solani]